MVGGNIQQNKVGGLVAPDDTRLLDQSGSNITKIQSGAERMIV